MSEKLNKVLSNIKYTIHNYSNYDISLEETRDIVDVPYFPAQNLVDIEGIEVFNPTKYVDRFIYLRDKNDNDRVLALINKPDQRILFVEFQYNSRYLLYRFGGTNYPQGKTKYSFTHTKDKVYIGFGEANDRYVDGIWVYDINENIWENINFHIEEESINTRPSKRGKTNLVVLENLNQLWIFGGETDILKLHTSDVEREFIPLNDLWLYDLNEKKWYNFDKKRILPHRQGNIVFIDTENEKKVKIVIDGGINEIGEYEPLGIWEVNLETDEVNFIKEYKDCPFTPSYENIPYVIDGVIHYLINGKLYKWDNENNIFVLVKENITDVEPDSKRYLEVYEISKERGNDINFGSVNIKEAKTYSITTDDNGNEVETDVKVYSITPPVYGDTIPNVNIGNYQTIFLLGFINGKFNENIHILNHKTLDTKEIGETIAETEKPQERVYPAICYDRYRNGIWIFGGSDGSRFYNDLWFFDLTNKTFTKVFDEEYAKENNLPIPEPRFKAGIAVVVEGQYLYLIGGYSDTKAFNDFWQFDIKNKKWTKVQLIDNIPFGSQYFIFEWRDRLFLFNGEPDGIYRLYWDNKQFIKQPFVIDSLYCSEGFLDKVRKKEYLENPLNVKLINDYLFISNDKFFLKVDLNTRRLEELSFTWNLPPYVYPLDHFKFLDMKNLKLIYINVSELQPLTKNQIPNSLYSKLIEEPENSGLFLYDWINTKRLIYYDESGKYVVQGQRLPLDKAKLIVNNEVSIIKTNNEVFNDVNFEDKEEVFEKTLEYISLPYIYPFQPWFLYDKVKPAIDYYKGVRDVIYDELRQRVFLVYNSGNIVKLNLHDLTFFIYHPNFWEGSAIGYNKIKGKFYCFFGLRDENKRTPYTQHGFECSQLTRGCSGGKGIEKEMSHCGSIILDINVNELSVRSLEDYLRENNVSIIDYTKTRDYLISLVKKYIESREQGQVLLNENEIKKKIYLATQNIVDDISTLNKIYEKGERPKARAYPIYTQIDNKLYIFGGCESYIKVGDTCPQINKPYFTEKIGGFENLPDEERDLQSRLAVYYDMDTDEWKYLKPLPFWLYLGSAIPSPDKRYIYIVGGYRGENCSNPYNGILIYDTQKDEYFEVKGIPEKYLGRARPILYWLDDFHLLIMYGSIATLYSSGDETNQVYQYIHYPIGDGWILDIKHNIMYRAFKDLISIGGVSIKDYYIKSLEDELESERNQYILLPFPIQNANGEIEIRLYKYSLTTGDVEFLKIIPTTEILKDFKFTIVDNEDGKPLEFKKLSLG